MVMILLARGLVGLFFAATLTRSAGVSWDGYFEVIAQYLLIDGMIAALLGGMLLRESFGKQRERELALAVVMLTDAGGRFLSGAALWYWPGLSGFPVTAAVFVAIMASCTAAVGVVEAWLTAREELARHGRAHETPQFIAGPVGLASLVSIGFGIAAIISIGSPDRTRVLITGFVAAAAGVSFAMAWSAQRQRGRRLRAAST